MTRLLEVYLQDHYAGQLQQEDNGELTWTYHSDYLSNNKLAISLALPLQPTPFTGNAVKAFFSGLLPDDIARHRLARYLGVSEKNPFALLESIGGECAGALSLYPEGMHPTPDTIQDHEVLDDKKLQDILNLLKKRPLLAGEDGLRLSLAGAQDKIAVSVQEQHIVLVRGSHPTTHILKPLISDLKDSVYNELFCTLLAKAVGIEAPHAELRYLNDTPYFLIERYDRTKTSDGKILRVHQEDFCQALGILPELKYEREGGPSFTQCQTLLQQKGLQPAADRLRLLDRILYNYLIGNADAHGKNFSLLYHEPKPILAPAYDLFSTAVYPELAIKMAMRVGSEYHPDRIFMRHWETLVPSTQLAKKNLYKKCAALSQTCLEQSQIIQESLKNQGITSPIFESIQQVIQKRGLQFNY